MNQTGLSESMVPSVTSQLFSEKMYEDSFIKSTIEEIPKNVFPLKKYKLPLNFDIMPLFKQPQTIDIQKGHLIPVCSKCGAFPNEFCRFCDGYWKCAVCGMKNQEKPIHVLPNSSDYQIITAPEDEEKPLFLFIIQSNGFFSPCIKPISDSILNWCKKEENKNIDIGIVTIDSKITLYDPEFSRAHIIIDVDELEVPVCRAEKANFELSETKTFEVCEDFFKLLSCVLNGVKDRSNVVTTLFIDNNPLTLSYEEVAKYFNNKTRTLHLFTTKSNNCSLLALESYRIRLFDSNEASIVAPVLTNWLSSGSLFDVSLHFYCSPTCFGDNFITTRFSSEGNEATVPFIDGESSFSIETNYKRANLIHSVFQVSLFFIFSNGVRGMRIISWCISSSEKLTTFDGITFAVQLARDCANSLQVNQKYLHYGEFIERCIELISAWSEKGAYIKKIDAIFKDVPILMYGITKSPMFHDNEIESIADKINLLTMSTSRVCRSIYPILILPPLKFPHRLTKSSMSGMSAALIVGPYKGKAFGESENLASVEVFKVPFILEESIDPILNDFIEDSCPTFASFTEKIEIECNGRRFV